MKKVFLTLLMSAAILSGSMMLPASTEKASAESTVTVGGNINWGSSNAVLPTTVSTAKTGCVLLGIEGSYITDTQNALNRVNEIRKEACDLGFVRDPRNPNRYLTSSDYVPIKWSSDLEYIARIRAAEASLHRDHIRLNEEWFFTAVSPNGIQSTGEVLAWNGSKQFLMGIEQWYGEMGDWIGNTGKVTGHYTAMINPDNTYVGLATFINPNIYRLTTTAGEFSKQSGLDESAGPAIENCIQIVEVKTSKVTTEITAFENSLAANNSVQAKFEIKIYSSKAEPVDTVNWESSDETSASVNSTGMVTGVHEGSSDITASYGAFTATQNIKVTGHPNTEVRNAKDASCSEEGYTGDIICKDCSFVEKGTVIPKKEHSWDEGTITEKPTCTETGAKRLTCKVCKITKTETIPANGHQAVIDAAVAATCEKEGKTQGSHCSVCNEILTAQEPVKAAGHSWDAGKAVIEATCEETGVKTYTCTSCQKTKTEETAALGHMIVTDAAVAATCEKAGKTEGSHCSVCNQIFVKQETIKASGHKVVIDPAVEAGCETKGKTEGSHCSVCGKVIVEQTTIKAAGHDWEAGKVTKAAACEIEGRRRVTCKKCKVTKTEKVPALGHKPVTDAAIEATCQTEGKTEGSHCSLCGKILKTQRTVKVTGHKFGKWETIKEADFTSAEIQSRTCSVCKKSEQRTVGKKLRAAMKVNTYYLPMKFGQKTTSLKVTGLIEGDSIVSWEISDKKIAKVKGKANGTCTITAGSIKGRTALTITTKNGAKKTVRISVQKEDIKTQKITGIAKTLKLKKKEKAALVPVLTPVTSTEKVTYKSSNSKIAAVNAKGQVTAKKKGTAVITVKSGKKTVKCKVTVR